MGFLLDNGNFIFTWNDAGLRKMVLVSNSGLKIKSGYLNMPATTWKDTSTWKVGQYTISNFQGVSSGRLSVVLFLLFCYKRHGLISSFVRIIVGDILYCCCDLYA